MSRPIGAAGQIRHVGIRYDSAQHPSRRNLILIPSHVAGLQAVGDIQRSAQQSVLTVGAGAFIFHAMTKAAIPEITQSAAGGDASAALHRAASFRYHHRPFVGEAEHRAIGFRAQRPLPVVPGFGGRSPLRGQPLHCIEKGAERHVGGGLVVRNDAQILS